MGNLRGAMEKSFVFFAVLLFGCMSLALLGMFSGLVMFGLVVLTASAAVGMMLTQPSEQG